MWILPSHLPKPGMLEHHFAHITRTFFGQMPAVIRNQVQVIRKYRASRIRPTHQWCGSTNITSLSNCLASVALMACASVLSTSFCKAFNSASRHPQVLPDRILPKNLLPTTTTFCCDFNPNWCRVSRQFLCNFRFPSGGKNHQIRFLNLCLGTL